MACPSSMASERKPPELTPSTTFDNISRYKTTDFAWLIGTSSLCGQVSLIAPPNLVPITLTPSTSVPTLAQATVYPDQ